jgi:hypothetical protein
MMVPNHMPGVSGFKNIHAFLLMLSLTGTIIAIPDSVYGRVKSTYELLYHISVKVSKKIIQPRLHKGEELNLYIFRTVDLYM